MTLKTLDDWLLGEEVHRLTLDNIKNMPSGSSDVDDDVPNTRGYEPYIPIDEIVDPNSLRPFDAIRFASESEEERIITMGRALIQNQTIEFNGKFYSSAEIDGVLRDNAPEVESEKVGHPEDNDFGPATISGFKLVSMTYEGPREKESSVRQRLSRAKTSGLKQDHRRIIVDLSMLASSVEL